MLPDLEPTTVLILAGFLLLSAYQTLRWRWRFAWWDRIQLEQLSIGPENPDGDDGDGENGPGDTGGESPPGTE